MDKYIHSIKLQEESCKGCTNCIKRCPTEAIRVRKGKARIIDRRCIDCGVCVRVCPHHAKKTVTDKFDMIFSFKYRIILPAPSFYAQFKNVPNRSQILKALIDLGFDEVFEVAKAAEIVSQYTAKMLKEGKLQKPVISSACPASVRLIQVRFPNLVDNILPLDTPMELAGKIAKKEAVAKTGLKKEEIGVFFISPCAAKVTSVKAPFFFEKSVIDGVFSMNDIYLKIINKIPKPDNASEVDPHRQSGDRGLLWAVPGGESSGTGSDKSLSVDGIHNVIDVLELVENDYLNDIEFIETLGCVGGCMGGPLTVENNHVAMALLKEHAKKAKKTAATGMENEYNVLLDDIILKNELEAVPILKLDDNLERALEKAEQMEDISKKLPGLDCGACGAPSCHALAEDIVRGMAEEIDCIFKFKEKVTGLKGMD